MKFWQFLRFAPPEMLPRLAQVAEDAGFHGAMLVDHMFVPEQFDTTGTLYSTGQDGAPFWGEEDPWPDPWAATQKSRNGAPPVSPTAGSRTNSGAAKSPAWCAR